MTVRKAAQCGIICNCGVPKVSNVKMTICLMLSCSYCENPAPARFAIRNLAKSGSGQIWNWIWKNKSGTDPFIISYHIISYLFCHIKLVAHATITQQSLTVTGNQKQIVNHSWQPIISNITYSLCPSMLWCCLLGGRKGIRPVKNWVAGCWRSYLSGARCRFAYGPADANANHYLLLQ